MMIAKYQAIDRHAGGARLASIRVNSARVDDDACQRGDTRAHRIETSSQSPQPIRHEMLVAGGWRRWPP